MAKKSKKQSRSKAKALLRAPLPRDAFRTNEISDTVLDVMGEYLPNTLGDEAVPILREILDPATREHDAKMRSGLTRRDRDEYDREKVLRRFDLLRRDLKSDTACAKYIATSGETFRHRSGEKRPISRNTILKYVTEREEAREHERKNRPAM